MADDIYLTMPSEECNYKLADPSLLQYYTDLSNRTINLLGEVDDGLFDFGVKVIQWNREDVGIPVEKRKPIKFFINSPGGSLDVYRSIRDIIELSETPIIAINLGCAYSAAAMLFLCCPQRYMLKSSTLLLHRGSGSLNGNFNELKAAFDDYKRQVEEFTADIQKHTDYDADFIETKMQTDWYVDAEEALAHGAATKIISNIGDLL